MARAKTSRRGKKATRTSIRDRARQAANKRERGGSGLDTLQNIPQDIEFFKPKAGPGKKGMNQFSIVPYITSIENHPFQEPGEPWPECTYWQHVIGTAGDQKRFICPAKTEQSESRKCPICEYRSALIKSGQDPDLADELKPKQRQIFNILDHNDEDKGIQLFEISPYMFGFALDDEDKAQAEDFDDKYYGDFEDGLSIKARFSESSFGGKKFAEIARIDFEERDDLPEGMVTEEAVDLDAALKILDYDEIHKQFHELGDEEEGEGTEEEEKEGKTRRSRKPKTSRRKEEEEEERKIAEEEGDEPEDGNECPEGLDFGTSCDSVDICDDCGVWEDCKDYQDELEDEKRKKEKTRSSRR